MKKLLVLALVALVASSAFAATDPVFSGSFSAWWGYNLTDRATGNELDDSHSYDASIDLGATIDDFNTLSVSIKTADAMTFNDTADDGSYDAGTDFIDLANTGKFMQLGSFNVTTDVMGALGVDAPVALSIEWGSISIENVSVGGGVNTGKTASEVGMKFNIGLVDMVTISTVLCPNNLIDEDIAALEYGVTAQVSGIADMIDVAVYYIDSADGDDGPYQDLGISLAATVIDGLKIGVGTNINLEGADPIIALGLTVDATMIDGLSISFGFNTDDLTNAFMESADMSLDLGFTMVEGLDAGLLFEVDDLTTTGAGFEAAKLTVDLTYAISDALSVYGAFKTQFGGETGYEAGIMTGLGAMNVTLGFADMWDGDWEFKAPSDDFNNAIFLKVDTSF